MIENPITPSNMFATPKDMAALMDYCDRFTGTEKIAAYTCAAMAWNLAHKVVQAGIDNMKGESK